MSQSPYTGPPQSSGGGSVLVVVLIVLGVLGLLCVGVCGLLMFGVGWEVQRGEGIDQGVEIQREVAPNQFPDPADNPLDGAEAAPIPATP